MILLFKRDHLLDFIFQIAGGTSQFGEGTFGSLPLVLLQEVVGGLWEEQHSQEWEDWYRGTDSC